MKKEEELTPGTIIGLMVACVYIGVLLTMMIHRCDPCDHTPQTVSQIVTIPRNLSVTGAS